MIRPRIAAASVLLLTAPLAAGCGSTVSGPTAGADGSVAGLSATSTGGSAQGPAGSGSSSATGTATLQAGGGTATTGSGTSLGAAPGGGSSAPGASTRVGQTGRGFTATTIDIGVPTNSDYSSYVNTLGIKGLDVGDTTAQATAVVDDINRHGGLLGRKIRLVKHDYNTAQELNDPATADQAACADWTQDHHVFAVLSPGGAIYPGDLIECLKQADTPLIMSGGIDAEWLYRPVYRQYPNFFDVGSMLRDRFDQVAIDRLVARKFFSSWDTLNGGPGTAAVKVGLLATDDAWGQMLVNSLTAQLAHHGLSFKDVIRCPAALSAGVACQQNSVLKMSSDGITHVFGAGLGFIETAESQHYHPRYFIHAEPATFAANAPADEMNGSMAESFVPAMDVAESQNPGDPSPATTYCKKVMLAAGQQPTYGATLWAMESICDAFYFVRDALAASSVLSTDGLRAGFEALGSTVPSALTWTSLFGPGEHANTRGVRDLGFDNGCSCYVYASKTTYQARN